MCSDEGRGQSDLDRPLAAPGRPSDRIPHVRGQISPCRQLPPTGCPCPPVGGGTLPVTRSKRPGRRSGALYGSLTRCPFRGRLGGRAPIVPLDLRASGLDPGGHGGGDGPLPVPAGVLVAGRVDLLPPGGLEVGPPRDRPGRPHEHAVAGMQRWSSGRDEVDLRSAGALQWSRRREQKVSCVDASSSGDSKRTTSVSKPMSSSSSKRSAPKSL